MSYIKHKNLNDRNGEPRWLITMEWSYPENNKFYLKTVVETYEWNKNGVGRRTDKAVFDSFTSAHYFYDQLNEEHLHSIIELDI